MRTTAEHSDSLAISNSQSVADAFYYQSVISGIPEIDVLKEYAKRYPECDSLASISKANDAFIMIANQSPDVVAGKTIARLAYQAGRAQQMGVIGSSIAAVSKIYEVHKKYTDARSPQIDGVRVEGLYWP